MARTTLTPVQAPGSTSYAGAAITMTAADTTNFNEYISTGKELIVAHNTGASTYTVTVTSAPDPYGRTKDIAAENITAGAYKVYGPFETTGWMQSDGRVYFASNNAAVKFGIIRL